MRLSGDVDDSFKFILGKEFKIIQKDWESFYSKQYTAEEGHIKEYSDETLIDLGYKNFFPKSDFKTQP